MEGWVPSLALRKRRKVIRKWPIVVVAYQTMYRLILESNILLLQLTIDSVFNKCIHHLVCSLQLLPTSCHFSNIDQQNMNQMDVLKSRQN